MLDYFWVCSITLIACTLGGLAGFGAIILSIPLLALFLDIKTVIPIAALASLTMHIVLLSQLKRHLDWGKLRGLLIGAVPGTFLGIGFLKSMNPTLINLILGLVLLVYSSYGLIFRPQIKGLKPYWGYVFGLAAGVLGGAFGASGPPVAVYSSLQTWNKNEVKATLQGYFILTMLLVVILHFATGVANQAVYLYYLAALPSVLLGTWIGSWLYNFVPEAFYRKIILLVLVVLAGGMIFRASSVLVQS